MFPWPQEPHLPPESVAELERWGVDSVRARLAGYSSSGKRGSSPDTICRFGNVAIQRTEVEEWLNWKESQSDGWQEFGWIGAAIAVVLAAALFFLKRY